MIIEMTRIRVLGPIAALHATVRALQDEGVVQIIDAACPNGLVPAAGDPIARRRVHHLGRVLADVDEAIAGLATLGVAVVDRDAAPLHEGRAARVAAQLRASIAGLIARERTLADERDALRAYEPLLEDLDDLLASPARRVSIYLLRVRGPAALAELRAALDRAFGPEHDLRSHTLASGETVVLLLVAATRAEEIDRQLAAARVERAPLPVALAAMPLTDALPRIRPRLAEVTAELAIVRADAAALARARGAELSAIRRGVHDALLAIDAEQHAATSSRVFVLEGWLPARDRERLGASLERAVGPVVAIEDVAREEWSANDAPVVLANPKLFAPFETLISLLPLPRYGSVDPTPFVAVFFPMLFGVVVGDVGYGLAIAAIALAIRRRSRSLARIAAAVSIYTIVFGVLYGELFGDLGRRAFGMQPLWFDRGDAVLGFLILAVALGGAHLVIGLIVAAANRWRRDKRVAIGRGLTAMMLVLLAVALLALFELLPAMFLMPAAIAVLVAFGVVVALEGATAILDLVSIVGHVLSYARVMALGTASLMLAIVANQMHGAFGSLALGVAFAVVFHLVNFAITLFSPTIHVMRLHYVEFFGTFFEPGGGPYTPLRHWSPEATTS